MSIEDTIEDTIGNDGSEPKSKSQRKRDMTALQDLGEALVMLPANQLSTIPMPESLLNAVMAARSITERGARKRQFQYIGKVMRKVDAAPIQEALNALNNQSQLAAREFHRVERWRDRLLSEGDSAVGDFISVYPIADSQHLRQLIRNAEREFSAGKPPSSARTLFRYVRDIMGE